MTLTLQPQPRRRPIFLLLAAALAMALAIAALWISPAVSDGEFVQTKNVEVGSAGPNPAAMRSIFGHQGDDASDDAARPSMQVDLE